MRAELLADRDVGRLLRYGESFGPKKIDVRWLQVQFPVPSGSIALCDPAAPRTWKVLDRPAGTALPRISLSIVKQPDKPEQLAAVVIHLGRPPIARWTVAHYRGHKPPKSEDQIPRITSTGWIAVVDAGTASPGAIAVTPGAPWLDIPLTDGRRAFAAPSGSADVTAYWAVDAADKPICLVLDFDVLTQKDWKARPS